jgi:vacuolar-type H+-ATPase subunit C/Vma6
MKISNFIYRNIDYLLNGTLTNHEYKYLQEELREIGMSETHQKIHDSKMEKIEVLYADLPPYAQEFVDKYREDIKRSARMKGNGPDEILKFIADLKMVIDESYKVYSTSATKGEIGNYTKGSGF